MILPVVKSVLTFLLVLAVFNLMIIVHELGHFLAAKWRGLVIEEFGVWFGKALWKKKIGGVWYSIGSLPFGGFVKLPQLAAMDTVEGKSETPVDQLPPVSPLSKIIVAFAGPLFSFLLAVAFAVIVALVGRPVSEAEATTIIGYVDPGSPAAESNLQPGDKILSIDGYKVTRWGGMGKDSITWRIVSSEGDTLNMEVLRDGQTLKVNPKPKIPETKLWERKAHRELGVMPAETPVIGAARITPGGPADQAHLQPGDHILKIDGKNIYSPNDIVVAAAQHPGTPFRLTVQRGTETFDTEPIAPRDAIVEAVVKDSPAAQAGVLPNDQVTAVNGQPYATAAKFSEIIQQNGAKPVTLDLMRNGKPLAVTVTPIAPEGDKAPRIGVQWQDDFGWGELEGITHLIYPGPIEQIKKAGMSIFETIGAITSRKSNVGLQHMSGPVMMMRAYYTFFQIDDGWRLALWFSVILNVNLAILNLLPIPPLDGSHITLSAIEAVRRRPVNVRIVEMIQTGCTVVIIGFMLYIFFYDVQDISIFHSGRGPKFSGHSAPPAGAQNK